MSVLPIKNEIISTLKSETGEDEGEYFLRPLMWCCLSYTAYVNFLFSYILCRDLRMFFQEIELYRVPSISPIEILNQK